MLLNFLLRPKNRAAGRLESDCSASKDFVAAKCLDLSKEQQNTPSDRLDQAGMNALHLLIFS